MAITLEAAKLNLTLGQKPVNALVPPSLLQEILQMPFETSGPSSDEDFYEPEGPSLREVFAKRRERFGLIHMIAEEKFDQIDKDWFRAISTCPPVTITLVID